MPTGAPIQPGSSQPVGTTPTPVGTPAPPPNMGDSLPNAPDPQGQVIAGGAFGAHAGPSLPHYDPDQIRRDQFAAADAARARAEEAQQDEAIRKAGGLKGKLRSMLGGGH